MDSATHILEIAERRMRQAGYNAVSYRDIAAEIGIKSASLHYHYPKKEDLGVALVRRYASTFHARLATNTLDLSEPHQYIAAFVEIYRFALEDQQLVCLCAVLGAEAPGLPEPVTGEVKKFFLDNIKWLSAQYEVLGVKSPMDKAKTTLALLEGAMILSSVNQDPSIFDAAARSVITDVA